MNNYVSIRMTRNIFLKDKNYQIFVNNQEYKNLNTKNNKLNIELNEGDNIIEIKSKKIEKTIHLNSNDKNKSITVYPTMTYEIVLGFFIGLASIYSIIIFFLNKDFKVNFPLLFLAIIPFFFLKKKNFEDTFLMKNI